VDHPHLFARFAHAGNGLHLWPIAGLIAIGGALLGVIVPVTKALRQDATEALSYE